MNETLQQFCQRILPVVQAGAEGKEIELDSKISGNWQHLNARVFHNALEYRIAKPKATPLPITPEMWAMIDPKYKWAAYDYICGVQVFEGKPKFRKNFTAWFGENVSNEMSSQLPLAIDTTGIVPELSLTERPDDVGAEANNDDCQLLVVSSWGAKSPFQDALDEMCCCGVPDRLFKFLSNIPSK